MPTPRSLCVFSSSSNAIAREYFTAAEELGGLLAQERIALVFGGGNIGLMGAMAAAAKRHGGRVIGVIPGFMRERGLAFEAADELIVTAEMRERKAVMESRADAFCAFPGGFGTLEEILEVQTLKQLGRHAKPIVYLNLDGFFDPLLALFEQLYRERFTKVEYRAHYAIATSPADVLRILREGRPPAPIVKWYE